MKEVIRIESTRQPDETLGDTESNSGWTIQPTPLKTNSTNKSNNIHFSTHSPASQLLSAKLLNSFNALHNWPTIFPVRTTKKSAKNKQKSDNTTIFNSLYKNLHQAYLKKDARRIDSIAQKFLNSNPVMELTRLDEITQKIYRFFTTKARTGTSSEFTHFVASFSQRELRAYFSQASNMVEITKAQIIASQVQGRLGGYSYNLIDVLRSVMAFQLLVAMEYRLRKSKINISVKPIRRLWGLNVFFESWAFDISPCKWQIALINESSESPLAKKIANIQAYKKQLSDQKSSRNTTVSDTNTDKSTSRHPHPECQLSEEADDGCDCTQDCTPVCKAPDPCCADINYYVTDLLVLREKTVCYEASDLAYIENVAPGENRVRKHAFKKTIEDYTEEETTESRTEERDHQVTDRSELQKQFEKQISQNLDIEASYGKEKSPYHVTTNASLSKDVSQREAREIFKESIAKATLKIQSETRKLRSLRVTTEETEKNKHAFNNATENPFVTKYFWVTQKKKAQVFSYGLRGTVELLIPTPAALYKHLEELKRNRSFDLKKPKHPCLLPSQIEPEKYQDYMIQYGLYDLEAPPEQPDGYWKYFTINENSGETIPITVPDGYTATSMKIHTYVMHKKTAATFHRVTIKLGGGTVARHVNYDLDYDPPKRETGTNESAISVRGDDNIAVDTVSIKDFEFVIGIYFTPDPVDSSSWQMEVYKKIMQQYEEELLKFEEALAEHQRNQEDRIKGRHPFAAKEIMLAEIKRAAIYMMCEDFEREGVMNMRSKPCGYPEIERRAADEQMWDWYFWDRAFDWELMSFKFFDYFWNPFCMWPDTFDPDEPNYLFKAFLRAGYLRLQIPVAKTMDKDVLWYIKTGGKWGETGIHPLNDDDPRWKSVIHEIKHSYDCYQNDREGMVTGKLDENDNNTNQIIITGTDRYWDPNIGSTGDINTEAIYLDNEHEIYIDGIQYRIQDIERVPNSPDYDPDADSEMQWCVTLDRIFEGEVNIGPEGEIFPKYNYAIGAKFIGSPILFDLPTDLIWIGDHKDKCLPCYPIECP